MAWFGSGSSGTGSRSSEGTASGEIGDYRWQGYSNAELATTVSKLGQGGGAESLGRAADAVRQLAASLDETDRTLRDELAKIGVVWRSDAADEAMVIMSDSARFGSGAEAATGVASVSVQEQGDLYSTTRNSAPDPQTLRGDTERTSVDNIATLFGHETDHAREVRRTEAARQAAIDVLTRYTEVSRQSLAAQQPLPEPPGIHLHSEPAADTTSTQRAVPPGTPGPDGPSGVAGPGASASGASAGGTGAASGSRKPGSDAPGSGTARSGPSGAGASRSGTSDTGTSGAEASGAGDAGGDAPRDEASDVPASGEPGRDSGPVGGLATGGSADAGDSAGRPGIDSGAGTGGVPGGTGTSPGSAAEHPVPHAFGPDGPASGVSGPHAPGAYTGSGSLGAPMGGSATALAAGGGPATGDPAGQTAPGMGLATGAVAAGSGVLGGVQSEPDRQPRAPRATADPGERTTPPRGTGHGGRRSGAGSSMLHRATAADDQDDDHVRRYGMDSGDAFGDRRMVAPSVLGDDERED